MNFFGSEIQFDNPGFLTWSWAIVLFVVGACVLGYFTQKALRNSYSHPDNLNRTTRALSIGGLVVKVTLWGLAGFLLAVALAGPYQEDQEVTVPEGSLHVVAAFDVSLSMAAEDYRDVLPTADGAPPVGPWGSRLMTAKHVFVNQVFEAIPGNKVGLVTFTADGYPQAPLCEDYSTIRYIMTETGWTGILSAPGGGSDYLEGLNLSIQTLRRDFDPDKHQVIMIFSDGGEPAFEDEEEKTNWEASLSQTVRELEALKKEAGGKLHLVVVAVGGLEKQMIPLYHPQTLERVDWFPFQKEEKATTSLDEAGLKRLVSLTGATYIHLSTDGGTQVPIDWAAAMGGTKTTKGKLPLSQYPMLAAMTIMALILCRALLAKPDSLPSRPTFAGRR